MYDPVRYRCVRDCLSVTCACASVGGLWVLGHGFRQTLIKENIQIFTRLSNAVYILARQSLGIKSD